MLHRYNLSESKYNWGNCKHQYFNLDLHVKIPNKKENVNIIN